MDIIAQLSQEYSVRMPGNKRDMYMSVPALHDRLGVSRCVSRCGGARAVVERSSIRSSRRRASPENTRGRPTGARAGPQCA